MANFFTEIKPDLLSPAEIVPGTNQYLNQQGVIVTANDATIIDCYDRRTFINVSDKDSVYVKAIKPNNNQLRWPTYCAYEMFGICTDGGNRYIFPLHDREYLNYGIWTQSSTSATLEVNSVTKTLKADYIYFMFTWDSADPYDEVHYQVCFTNPAEPVVLSRTVTLKGDGDEYLTTIELGSDVGTTYPYIKVVSSGAGLSSINNPITLGQIYTVYENYMGPVYYVLKYNLDSGGWLTFDTWIARGNTDTVTIYWSNGPFTS